jgi:hypothetical protein
VAYSSLDATRKDATTIYEASGPQTGIWGFSIAIRSQAVKESLVALYVLIFLECVGLVILHSIDASLGGILGALENINEGIESLVEK